jgi:hypothetical protein
MLRFLQGLFCIVVAAVMILCFFAEKNNLGLADATQAITKKVITERKQPLDLTKEDHQAIERIFQEHIMD